MFDKINILTNLRNENDQNERKQIGHCENTVSKKNYKNTAIKKIFVKM